MMEMSCQGGVFLKSKVSRLKIDLASLRCLLQIGVLLTQIPPPHPECASAWALGAA